VGQEDVQDQKIKKIEGKREARERGVQLNGGDTKVLDLKGAYYWEHEGEKVGKN